MTFFIQIIAGVIIGAAGFFKIADSPMQGISALFLAGFLILTGFEKKFLKDHKKSEIELN